MYHDFDAIVRKAKQKMCFDDFEGLVGERRAVDGDLAAHLPGRVPQGIIHTRRRESLRAPAAEWSARRGEHDSTDGRRRVSGDALKDGAVLAVNGNDLACSRGTRLPHQVSGDDPRL